MSVPTSSLVLPEWQDDSDVGACPICKRTFHFLFRKHHCRRCGRIICDQCSPHRITLPRQYIVRPPWGAARFRIDTGDDEDVYTSEPSLGGGETVRVCNPCVPDPNYGPPPAQSVLGVGGVVSRAPIVEGGDWPGHDRLPGGGRASTFASPRRSPERSYPDRYRTTGGGAPPSPTRRSQHTDGHHSHAGPPSRQILHSRTYSRGSRPSLSPPVPSTSRPIPPLSRPPSMRPRTRSGSLLPAYTHIFATPGSQHPSSQFPGLDASPSRPALRQILSRAPQSSIPAAPIREEDECPVCGTHAPPFGPDGDQSAREVHIESCIANHLQFSSTPQSQVAVHAPPRPPTEREPTAVPSLPPASTSFNAARLPSLSQSSLPPATPPNSFPRTAGYQRMLLFHATEKDCQPDPTSDDPPECVICFEEFSPGQEMGRLECLCKFHRACIRAWWESGPPAAMPGLGPVGVFGSVVGPSPGNLSAGQHLVHGVTGSPGSAVQGPRKGERWGTCPTHVLHH